MNNRNDLVALIAMQINIILLKLANINPFLSWSWIWVLSFMWIPFVLGIFIILILKKNKEHKN